MKQFGERWLTTIKSLFKDLGYLIFFADPSPVRFTIAIIHLLLGSLYLLDSPYTINDLGVLYTAFGGFFIVTGTLQLMLSVIRKKRCSFTRMGSDFLTASIWCFYVVVVFLYGGKDYVDISTEAVLGLTSIWVFLRSSSVDNGVK